MKIKFIALLTLLIPLSSNAVEVSKSDWYNNMSTALPTVFCDSSQYFRHCFSVSSQECEETAASATRLCLNKYDKDIPNVLVQPRDVTHWGTIIGKCAGETYELALIKRRVNNMKCSDASN